METKYWELENVTETIQKRPIHCNKFFSHTLKSMPRLADEMQVHIMEHISIKFYKYELQIPNYWETYKNIMRQSIK